jgi:hypothetical protein
VGVIEGIDPGLDLFLNIVGVDLLYAECRAAIVLAAKVER